MKRYRPLSRAAFEFSALALLACGQVQPSGTGAGGVSVGSSAGVEPPLAGQATGASAGSPGASAGSPGISFAGSSNGGIGGLASGGAPSAAGSGTAGDGASAGSGVRGNFRPLGFPNRTDRIDSPSISADGTVVVATATLSSDYWDRLEAVKWTLEGGFESLGLTQSALANPITSSAASVSGDGSVIVGDQRTLSYRPFLHNERMTRYLMPEESSESTATWDVSVDGSVVVGMLSTEDGDSHAFRWTAETGMVSSSRFPLPRWELPTG
ncbi:MAG TPA: hypothetical protein VEX18_21690 [Polyangiaceae bacterium]|nr:hypothetical protein [Polyangiaceae bacterium]